MIPADPQERDALAGEYVLGTLDARLAEEVGRALPADARLRAAVAAWEARLAPLLTLPPPETPPPDLWNRIEAALPGARPAPKRPRLGLWHGWAIGASALAAGLAAFLLLRPAPAPQLLTVLLASRDQPAWLVRAEPGGALHLAALNPQPVVPDRVMELWALPPGAAAPTSLGVIPPEGRITVTSDAVRPQTGMLIEISLEPAGGSPTGRLTGPVLFIGRLSTPGTS